MRSFNTILLEANNSSQALAALYRCQKEKHQKFSMAYVCTKAGIPSRGYLNDVMKGKRRLNLKYTKGICRAFGLSGFAAKYLSTLIRYENERERKKQLKFESKIKLLRKVLAVSEKKDISSDLDHAFCFKLFACFGLFDRQPTGAQLLINA